MAVVLKKFKFTETYNRTYFVCKDGLEIDDSMKDDLVPDCGPDGEDNLI